MTSRMRALALLLVLAAPSSADTPRASARDAEQPRRAGDLLTLVNPFIGTGGDGNTYPGAQVPWGMVSVSPHNDPSAPSGYRWGKPLFYGVGHVHLSGTGCPDLGNILLTAVSNAAAVAGPERFASRYSAERASPGYYRVDLASQISLEATATVRTGLTRFTFGARMDDARIVFDLGARLPQGPGPAASPYLGSVRFLSATELAGWSEGGGFCSAPNRHTVYFDAVLSHPPERRQIWNGAEISETAEATGTDVGALCSFATRRMGELLVKVGISYVSIANARANLDVEQPGWDFPGVRRDAETLWERELRRIRVEGGTDNRRTMFYTALYHAMIHPSVFSDVNGEYRGINGSGVKRAEGRTQYHVFSLWDSYRTVHPLLALVWPERQLDMVRSMAAMAKDGGWLPKWELAGDETRVMVGDPGTIVAADSYCKGLADFDVPTAYAAARRAATQAQGNPVRPGLASWIAKGYIPEDHGGEWIWGTVSTALEYALADWHLARWAARLGHEDDAREFDRRAQGYRNLRDPSTGFLRPRYSTGAWLDPFDPLSMKSSDGWDAGGGPGYVEGNAWHYRFFVPHDLPGLIETSGGVDEFTASLRECFDLGQFVLWNEPDFHVPWLFAETGGDAWEAQARVREALTASFSTAVDGLPGNDDAGATSGWAIFACLGLYPVCPGSGVYQLASPLFDRATITLDKRFYPGETFTIRGARDPGMNPYVQGATLNGKPLDVPRLTHAEITRGGTIAFDLGPQPAIWGGTARPPVILRQPEAATVIEGSAAAFQVRAGGTGPLGYQWRRDDQDVPGARHPRLELAATPVEADGGSFACAVTSPYGRVLTRPVRLTVTPDRTPPVPGAAILTAPDVITVSFSEPVDDAAGGDAASYEVYPAASIGRVVVNRDGRTVAVRLLRPLDLSRTPTLGISRVRDRAARPNTMSPARLWILAPGDGLSAGYFDGPELSGHSVKRVDPAVNFRWGAASPDPSIPAGGFSARWTGKIRADYGEDYTFTVPTDDGVRLWVNEHKVLDAWRDQQHAGRQATVRLNAGGLTTLWLEYTKRSPNAAVSLIWSSPSVPRAVVPQDHLYTK